jgi:aspartate aminotransferase
MFADRIDRIQPSATLAMTSKAAELRAKGVDVINLSVGEPDFPTPQNIQNAAIKAMSDGFTRYTPGAGMMDLRQAAADKMKRDNNLDYAPKEIIVSCGAKHSLYNACQVLFQTGDEVIIFAPYWVSFPDFVSITGATPVFVNTDASNQFEPDFENLTHQLTSNTKGIIINSPSNPTGGVWSDEAVKKVLTIAKENDLWVFSDECYEQLTYDVKYTSTATLTDDDSKILTFQSCSKTYAMTGWRIGYTAGDSAVIKAMSKLQGQSTSCPNSIAQVAAIEALSGDQSAVTEMRDAFKIRRGLIVNRLHSIEGVTCEMPGGAFYVFPEFKDYLGKSFNGEKINTSSDLSMYFLNEKAVVTVAGDSFGAPNNIRFSYAASEEELNNALDRVEDALQNLV